MPKRQTSTKRNAGSFTGDKSNPSRLAYPQFAGPVTERVIRELFEQTPDELSWCAEHAFRDVRFRPVERMLIRRVPADVWTRFLRQNLTLVRRIPASVRAGPCRKPRRGSRRVLGH